MPSLPSFFWWTYSSRHSCGCSIFFSFLIMDLMVLHRMIKVCGKKKYFDSSLVFMDFQEQVYLVYWGHTVIAQRWTEAQGGEYLFGACGTLLWILLVSSNMLFSANECNIKYDHNILVAVWCCVSMFGYSGLGVWHFVLSSWLGLGQMPELCFSNSVFIPQYILYFHLICYMIYLFVHLFIAL